MNPGGYGGETELIREQTKYARRQKIGGLKRWVATFFGLNLVPAFDPAENLADREAERDAVLARLRATVRAGDTRAQHQAYIAARAATDAALRAVVR